MMILSLDLLSEYWIQHGAIGPLYATSSYSIWIFYRGFSGFATDCPCDVCCRGVTTCLLHVVPPFGNRFLNTSWAVGLTYWIVYLILFLYFDICSYICLDTSYHFLALSLLLKCFFFKYSCINMCHRWSLCTFYWIICIFVKEGVMITTGWFFVTRFSMTRHRKGNQEAMYIINNMCIYFDFFGNGSWYTMIDEMLNKLSYVMLLMHSNTDLGKKYFFYFYCIYITDTLMLLHMTLAPQPTALM